MVLGLVKINILYIFLKKKMVKQGKEQKVDEEQKHEIASGTKHNI